MECCALVFVGLDASTFRLFGLSGLPQIIRVIIILCDQHFIGHLPDFFGIADRAKQRIVQHGLFEQGYITVAAASTPIC